MIVEVSPHYLCQPAAGLLNRIVHAPAQFACNVPQFRCHSLSDCRTLYRKLAALPDRAADMREAQKVEGLGFVCPALFAIRCGEPTEFDEADCIRVKRHRELSQP